MSEKVDMQKVIDYVTQKAEEFDQEARLSKGKGNKERAWARATTVEILALDLAIRTGMGLFK